MIQVPLTLYFTFSWELKASVQNVQELYPMLHQGQKIPLHFISFFIIDC